MHCNLLNPLACRHGGKIVTQPGAAAIERPGHIKSTINEHWPAGPHLGNTPSGREGSRVGGPRGVVGVVEGEVRAASARRRAERGPERAQVAQVQHQDLIHVLRMECFRMRKVPSQLDDCCCKQGNITVVCCPGWAILKRTQQR